jgi:hypothetical protein
VAIVEEIAWTLITACPPAWALLQSAGGCSPPALQSVRGPSLFSELWFHSAIYPHSLVTLSFLRSNWTSLCTSQVVFLVYLLFAAHRGPQQALDEAVVLWQATQATCLALSVPSMIFVIGKCQVPVKQVHTMPPAFTQYLITVDHRIVRPHMYL